jgi:hypothetical protein
VTRLASPLVLLSLTLLLARPGAAQIGGPEAPDGRRGLGADGTAQEILHAFRAPNGDEEQLLAELRTLRTDVDLQVASAHGLYSRRGYYELLPPSVERSPEPLAAAFEQLASDPDRLQRASAPARQAFARLFFDTRFRARAPLLAAARLERRELDAGLAVLRAATDGFVSLQGPEARGIARRVDLAAARLRAIRTDLDALRELPWDVGVAPSWTPNELVTRLLLPTSPEGRGDPRASEADRVARMQQLFVSSRPGERLTRELLWRNGADARAEDWLASAARALPTDDEDEAELQDELRGLTRTKRRRMAWEQALRGLEEDPLDPDLAWLAGEASRYVRGTLETLGHYDRTLALSGIRSHLSWTYADRVLSKRLQETLYYVQQHGNELVNDLLNLPDTDPGGD